MVLNRLNKGALRESKERCSSGDLQEGGGPMKLVSIEPTPSPHTMKLNLDRRLPGDKGVTYTADNREEAPELLSYKGEKEMAALALSRAASGL